MLLKTMTNEKIKKETKIFLEANDNEEKKFQNLWEATKAVLRGKSEMIQAFLEKEEKSQINM